MPDPDQIVIEAQVSGAPSARRRERAGQIKAADPRLPISFIETLDTWSPTARATRSRWPSSRHSSRGLALLLACVGLYGVISYTVAGRTREIGVRMALGARRGDVMQLVLREGMLLVAIGLAVGIPLALASTRVLHSFLFGLKSTDPLSLAAVDFAAGNGCGRRRIHSRTARREDRSHGGAALRVRRLLNWE